MPGVCTAPAAMSAGLSIDESRKWNNEQVIFVRFLNGDEQLHSKVRQHASEWLQYANVNFNFVQDGPAHIRVKFDCSTSWSYIGTECLRFIANQRRQTMNLDPRDLQTEASCRSVILHEFGHALGCDHVSPGAAAGGIRWTRDVVHEFYWREQGWDKLKVDEFLKSFCSGNGSSCRGRSAAVDRQSIMVPPIPSGHARNVSLDWNAALSDMDKGVISAMYPGRWTGCEEEELEIGRELERVIPVFQASLTFPSWDHRSPSSAETNPSLWQRFHSSKELVV